VTLLARPAAVAADGQTEGSAAALAAAFLAATLGVAAAPVEAVSGVAEGGVRVLVEVVKRTGAELGGGRLAAADAARDVFTRRRGAVARGELTLLSSGAFGDAFWRCSETTTQAEIGRRVGGWRWRKRRVGVHHTDRLQAAEARPTLGLLHLTPLPRLAAVAQAVGLLRLRQAARLEGTITNPAANARVDADIAAATSDIGRTIGWRRGLNPARGVDARPGDTLRLLPTRRIPARFKSDETRLGILVTSPFAGGVHGYAPRRLERAEPLAAASRQATALEAGLAGEVAVNGLTLRDIGTGRRQTLNGCDEAGFAGAAGRALLGRVSAL